MQRLRTAVLILVLTAARFLRCSSFEPRVTLYRAYRQTTSSLCSTKSSNSNHLIDISSLQNEYCVLRHGQSMANVEELISSSPQVATIQHGLSDVGNQQAQEAGRHVVEYYQQHEYDGIVILSSDYKRAKETAEIVADCCLKANLPLYRNEVVIETRLRERWFGDWDGGSDRHYNDVWKDDADDPSHTIRSVESVDSVMDRTTSCVLQWDGKFSNNLILLVAHGDVLQIMQTAFHKMDGSLHRTCKHLETATLRPLVLAPASAE